MSKIVKIILVIFFIGCSDSEDFVVIAPPEEDITYPVTAGNQKIIEIMNRVSEDSLRAFVSKLENFYTRQTNSDTVSESRGIGAARRWIFSKYDSYKENKPGSIEVFFDRFEQSINGPLRLHMNVVYKQLGSDYPDRVFLIGGHMDSRNSDINDTEGFAGGANDDGSGTAATIELARIFSNYTFKSTIILVAFTGEEQGLHGSRHMAERFVQEGVRLEGMITLDMIGNSIGGSGNVDNSSVRVFSQGPELSVHRKFAAYIKVQGETYMDNFTVNFIPSFDRPQRGGDHKPFTQNGFTSARLTEPEDNMNHQHNDNDKIEFMDLPYLTKNVKLAAAVLAGLADAPPLKN